MKLQLSSAFGFLSLLAAGLASAPADSATTAAGSYYATPSWDQQLPVATRFIVLSNWVDAGYPTGGAAVLDRETGLVWQRAPLYPITAGLDWPHSVLACYNAKTGSRAGWRLPTTVEMMTLVDPGKNSPALPAGHPFQQIPSATPAVYWTSTLFSPNFAFDFFVDVGGISGDSQGFQHGVWCVRGGSDGLDTMGQP